MTDIDTLRAKLQALLERTEADRSSVESEWHLSRRWTKQLKRQLDSLDDQKWDLLTYLANLDRMQGLVDG